MMRARGTPPRKIFGKLLLGAFFPAGCVICLRPGVVGAETDLITVWKPRLGMWQLVMDFLVTPSDSNTEILFLLVDREVEPSQPSSREGFLFTAWEVRASGVTQFASWPARLRVIQLAGNTDNAEVGSLSWLKNPKRPGVAARGLPRLDKLTRPKQGMVLAWPPPMLKPR